MCRGVSVYGCVRARVWCMIACLFQQDRGLMGKILNILPKTLGQELLLGKGRSFLSARGKPFCVSYLEVSHCVSASQR